MVAAREVTTITRSACHVQGSSRGTATRIARGYRRLILSFNILAGISNLRRIRGTYIVLSVSPPGSTNISNKNVMGVESSRWYVVACLKGWYWDN